MSEETLIAISTAGTYTVRIPDSNGTLCDYRVRWGERQPQLVLYLSNAENAESYRVGQDPGRMGRWLCSCPSFTYKKRGEHHCKHTKAARNLLALLEDLETCLLNTTPRGS